MSQASLALCEPATALPCLLRLYFFYRHGFPQFLLDHRLLACYKMLPIWGHFHNSNKCVKNRVPSNDLNVAKFVPGFPLSSYVILARKAMRMIHFLLCQSYNTSSSRSYDSAFYCISNRQKAENMAPHQDPGTESSHL